MRTTTSLFALTAAALLAAPANAQTVLASAETAPDTTAAMTDTVAAPAAKKASLVKPITIQNMRPVDQRGINIFEAPKEAGVPFTGFKLDFGAAFTQQYQGLSHENTAVLDPDGDGVSQNRLMTIGQGFNLATANLYVNAQLAPGIRVALSTYLSSRHHNETWVKDGYLLIDGSPIDHPTLNKVMEYVTIRAGHMELNYGDGHFRRSDNGNAMYNPFVGNLILDAFTTEIGGEVYVRSNGFMGMVGITDGVNKGDVTNPQRRRPGYYGKLGVDRQLSDDVRVRLTGSTYQVSKTPSATLFAGDRAGSRYYMVLDNSTATTSAQYTSGLLNPGLRNKLVAYQLNPFIQFKGVELFGVIERAEGRASGETENREWTQYAIDGIYRFLDDQLYVGARYNTVEGELQGVTPKVGADRVAFAGGWFITPSILLKGEYVTQKYNDFPTTDIRNGGKFDGFVVEGVVAF
ncbi:MAG TPA: hypothetical protein VFZ11_04050 [Gemmatimonadaceae bacterium]